MSHVFSGAVTFRTLCVSISIFRTDDVNVQKGISKLRQLIFHGMEIVSNLKKIFNQKTS